MKNNNEEVSALSMTLQYDGPKGAEKHLLAIANERGDAELAVLVPQIPAHDLLRMINEGDYTKPSTAAPHVTADQFIEMLERTMASWGGNVASSEYYRILDNFHHFLVSIFLTGVSPQQGAELFNALVEHEVGADIPALIAFGGKDTEAFFDDTGSPDFQRGTWQEVIYLFSQEHPEYLKKVHKIWRSLRKKGAFRKRASDVFDRLSELAQSHVSDNTPTEPEKVWLDI